MPLPGFRRAELLDFRDGADFLELGDECLCRVLRNAFFDCLGGSVDNALRLDQTETGGVLDDLDDLDLVGADFLQDDVELRLLFLGGSSLCRTARDDCNGSRCADAELLLKLLDEFGELENGHALDFFHKFLKICHFFILRNFIFCVPPLRRGVVIKPVAPSFPRSCSGRPQAP